MGIPVLIIGESGSGKSASLRNFDAKEVGVFNVASKRLPFKKALPTINGADYNLITQTMAKKTCKAYVIDDANYLMAFENFRRVQETGYQKFTQMAINFYNLVQFVIQQMPDDTVVYFLQHQERTDDGHLKAKTIGKMLDNQLTLEGLFSIVLYCQTDGKRHWFTTQSDGYTTAKSPIGLFELEIDNDLKNVDQKIREYYELS